MIRTGEILDNPITGERLIFRQTAADTNGEAVVVETILQPDAFVAGAHVHPYQEERFHVLRGSVGFRLGRRRIVVGPGERVTVPAGTPHRFFNAGDEEAAFEAEVRPALDFQELIETMFGLAQDGKTNARGLPNPLRLAVIGRARFDTVRLPYVPATLQRLGLAMLAPLGRVLGYSGSYVPSAGRSSLAPS